MCEQMGWEPSEEEMPIDPSFLDVNAQYALLLLNALPDNWDSMGGSWLGKDYSGLAAIMDIYEIEDKKAVFELLKVAEDELGKFYRQKQKEQESLAKAKRAR
jgi:hypothetical protein